MTFSFLSILVAAICSMVVGMIWYGPLFGKLWMSAVGLSEEKLKELKSKGMGGTMLTAFFMSFLMAYVLAFFTELLNFNTLEDALFLTTFVWLGFIVTTMINSVLWEGRSVRLYMLNISHQFVSILVVSLILILWS